MNLLIAISVGFAVFALSAVALALGRILIGRPLKIGCGGQLEGESDATQSACSDHCRRVLP